MIITSSGSHDDAFVSGRVCLDFVNTLRDKAQLERSQQLEAYDDLVHWSVAAGDLSEHDAEALIALSKSDPVGSAGVVERAERLRESLFEVFAAVTRSQTPSMSDLGAVNGELARISPHLCCLRWSDAEPTLGWSTSLTLDRPLWNVLRSATELLTSADRAWVKMCEHETCAWLFVDETRNHSRRWCDMSVCGNRAKARRFRSRSASKEDHAA